MENNLKMVLLTLFFMHPSIKIQREVNVNNTNDSINILLVYNVSCLDCDSKRNETLYEDLMCIRKMFITYSETSNVDSSSHGTKCVQRAQRDWSD